MLHNFRSFHIKIYPQKSCKRKLSFHVSQMILTFRKRHIDIKHFANELQGILCREPKTAGSKTQERIEICSLNNIIVSAVNDIYFKHRIKWMKESNLRWIELEKVDSVKFVWIQQILSFSVNMTWHFYELTSHLELVTEGNNVDMGNGYTPYPIKGVGGKSSRSRNIVIAEVGMDGAVIIIIGAGSLSSDMWIGLVDTRNNEINGIEPVFGRRQRAWESMTRNEWG